MTPEGRRFDMGNLNEDGSRDIIGKNEKGPKEKLGYVGGAAAENPQPARNRPEGRHPEQGESGRSERRNAFLADRVNGNFVPVGERGDQLVIDTEKDKTLADTARALDEQLAGLSQAEQKRQALDMVSRIMEKQFGPPAQESNITHPSPEQGQASARFTVGALLERNGNLPPIAHDAARAALLEKLVEKGILGGKVKLGVTNPDQPGDESTFAAYINSAGQVFVFDTERQVFGLLDRQRMDTDTFNRYKNSDAFQNPRRAEQPTPARPQEQPIPALRGEARERQPERRHDPFTTAGKIDGGVIPIGEGRGQLVFDVERDPYARRIIDLAQEKLAQRKEDKGAITSRDAMEAVIHQVTAEYGDPMPEDRLEGIDIRGTTMAILQHLLKKGRKAGLSPDAHNAMVGLALEKLKSAGQINGEASVHRGTGPDGTSFSFVAYRHKDQTFVYNAESGEMERLDKIQDPEMQRSYARALQTRKS